MAIFLKLVILTLLIQDSHLEAAKKQSNVFGISSTSKEAISPLQSDHKTTHTTTYKSLTDSIISSKNRYSPSHAVSTTSPVETTSQGLEDPNCLKIINKAYNDSISLNLSKISMEPVDGYDVVLYNDSKSVLYNETNIMDVQIENLQAGGRFLVEIRGVGKDNKRSGPCELKVYTLPKNPECDDITANTSQKGSFQIGYNGADASSILDFEALENGIQKMTDSNKEFSYTSFGHNYTIIATALNKYNTSYESSLQCRKIVSIPPQLISCRNVEVVNVTTTSLMLTYQLGKNFSQQFQRIFSVNDSKYGSIDDEQWSIMIGNLTSGKRHHFYIMTVGDNNVRSEDKCSVEGITDPKDPVCESFNITSSADSIIFRNVRKNDNEHYRIIVLADEAHPMVKDMTKGDTTFTKLKDGRKYNYSIHTLGDGIRTSKRNCSNTIYTWPPGPINCSEKFSVVDIMATRLTLMLPFSLMFDYILIVGNRRIWIPKKTVLFDVKELDPDKQYNITLLHVLKDDKGINITSSEKCTLTEWTRPSINCSRVYWDKTNLGWQVSHLYPSFKSAAFIRNDSDGNVNKTTVPYKEFLSHSFHLKKGKTYTLEMYIIGHGEMDSIEKCRKENVTIPIDAPKCSGTISTRTSDKIILDTRRLNFTETGAIFFRVEISPTPLEQIDHENVSLSRESIIYPNLRPGTNYTFTFRSLGKGSEVSPGTCIVSGCTRPTNPDCSKIKYTAKDDSMNISFVENLSTGAQRYDISLSKGNIVLQNCSAVSYVNFTHLQIGETFVASVTAIGLGELRSRTSCRKTVYTRPVRPNCNYTIDVNETAVNVSFFTSLPLPKGAIAYQLVVSTNTSNITNQKLDPEILITIPGLISGKHYYLSWKSVGMDDLLSTLQCSSAFYTKPSQPTIKNITVTNSSIILHWENKGVASSYTVKPNCICSSQCNVAVSNSENGTIRSTYADIFGLAAGSYCNISVTSHSGDMSSDPAISTEIFTKEEVPGPVKNISVLIESRQVLVSWDAPKLPNGKILNYSISLYGNKQESVIKTMFVEPDEKLSVQYDNLIPGSCYTIKIVASTKAGCGEESRIEVYTSEEVPGPVSSLETTNASSTSIQIEWGIPKDPNGVVLSYSVEIIKNDKCIKTIILQCEGCSNACPNSLSAKALIEDNSAEETNTCPNIYKRNFTSENTNFTELINGLKPSSTYRINVYAFTKQGNGSLSTHNQQTSEDVPSEIKSVSGTPNIKNIQIDFNRPVPSNGKIIRYDIECVPDNPIKMCYQENRTLIERITQHRLTSITDIERLDKVQVSEVIGELQPFWNYTVRIKGYTRAGHGNWSSPIVIRTNPYKPDPVRSLHYTDVKNRSITLSWIEPCFTNGIISEYRVFVFKENSTQTLQNTTSNNNNIVLSNLLPYTNYNIKVFGVTSGDTGGSSFKGVSTGMIRTLCEEPKEPTDLAVMSSTSKSIAVRWKQPYMKTCTTEYEVKATDVNESSIIRSCTTIGFDNVTCNITDLAEYWNYSFTLTAFTTYRNSSRSWNGRLLSRTSQAAPGPVTNVVINTERDVTKPRTITVRWGPPTLKDRNGIITSFTILYGKTDSETSMKKVDVDSLKQTYNLTISDIVPGDYIVRVYATTIHDASKENYVNTTNITLSSGALPLPKTSAVPLIQVASQVTVSNDEKQFPLSISKDILCDESYGEIIERGVIVSDASQIGGSDQLFRGTMSEFKKRKTSIYRTWQSVHDMDNMPPYIATDNLKVTCPSGRTKRSANSSPSYNYVIGSDGECDSGQKYCNGYLKPGKSYKARVYVCTAGGCTETQYLSQFTTEPNLVPVIAGGATGGIVAAAVVIIIVIIVIRIRRKRAKDGESTGDGETNFGFDGEMKNLKKGSKTSIQKSQFARKVEDLHADSNLIFAQEYKVIKENSPSHATEAAEQQSTRNKNRYTNILAYDHSRVKLLPTEDEEGSDYINANYIPGFNSQREYIATQGPQNCTKDDFWRMIWEQNVNVIVMLTQLIERGRRKCDQYWPNNTREPVFFGDLIVEMESESPMNDYILRVFSLKLGKNVKNVKHFQFLAWPDMGIPQTTECMLYFVRGVRDHTPAQRRGPIVVHCSAGVGRTGTFIAVDHLMQHVRTHDHLDIFNLVLTMRDNRTNMVQTEDQYIFIHDCIKDYIEELEHEDEDAEDGNVIEEPAYANAAIYANRS